MWRAYLARRGVVGYCVLCGALSQIVAYHFFWNYLHDFDLDNPNIALSLCNSLEEAFNEDLAIIGAQQKVFDADPNCGARDEI